MLSVLRSVSVVGVAHARHMTGHVTVSLDGWAAAVNQVLLMKNTKNISMIVHVQLHTCTAT